jgi:hypothetical protein
MKTFFIYLGCIVGLIILVTGIGWFAAGNDFIMFKFFAPRQEAVRRQVFEQTKSYNQGMIQELQNMQFEYIKSSKDQQVALRSIILHRAADLPSDRLPADLRSFINDLRNQ